MDEGVRLLSECRVKSSTEGSNPSLSAIVRTLMSVPPLIFSSPIIPQDKSILQKRSGFADKYNYPIMEDEKEIRDDNERSR